MAGDPLTDDPDWPEGYWTDHTDWGPDMTARQLADEINAILKDPGAVRLGDDPDLIVGTLPTGVLPIDVMLAGGLPRGRWTEVFGAYSTLKSYVAYRAIATTQASGGTCALIDTEHAWDPEWGEKLGVDNKALLHMRPDTAEKAVDLTEVLLRSGDVDLIVWDSIAAMNPEDEAGQRESGENVQPARLAALMSRGLRKLTAVNGQTAILVINQTREAVGITFGSPERTPGGKSLPFYASHRIAFRHGGRVTESRKYRTGTGSGDKVDGKVTTAVKIKATLEKSKLTRPHAECWFQFDLVRGTVNEDRYLTAVALDQGLIQETSQGRYTCLGHKAHGAAAVEKLVRENPEVREHLLSQVAPWLTDSPGDPAPAKKKATRSSVKK